jgi:signal transduction histidine kinase
MLETIEDDTASLHRLAEPGAGLRSRMEELAACNRRKDAFLGMLAHELRSPLASIQNAILILGSQTPDPRAAEH